MSISSIQLKYESANLAYGRASLFDKMKKQGSADAEKSESKADVELKGNLADLDLTATPKEKVKPNTIPFKPGFVFEYGDGSEDGKVSVTVHSMDKVSIELGTGNSSDERKKSIRAIVMLAVGKISREELNKSLLDGKSNMPAITRELKQMGVSDAIPFGLGESSYYINEHNLFAPYKPIDVKG